MANIIQLKRSGTAAVAPASLAFGELALNYSDGKLFYKNAAGSIIGSKLITSISGTANQINVTETSGAYSISLPSSVYVDSLFVDNIEIDTTGALPGQVLRFDGTLFLPDAFTLSDGADVSVSSPLAGQILKYDGAEWVNSTLPSNEPLGVVSYGTSNISFNEVNRTFTIAPANGYYEFWAKGLQYIKT